MTFDLASPEAKDWNYFADGRRQYEESKLLRASAKLAPEERLDPGIVWGYHDPNPDWAHLSIEIVDYYRYWPPAEVEQDLYEDIGASGFAQPLVIYSNGSHGLLGEGNHRLAVARALGMKAVPVIVVPDRLMLPQGMDAAQLVTLDPEVSNLTGIASRRHWAIPTSNRHGLSTMTFLKNETNVFCRCGAQWKRPKEI